MTPVEAHKIEAGFRDEALSVIREHNEDVIYTQMVQRRSALRAAVLMTRRPAAAPELVHVVGCRGSIYTSSFEELREAVNKLVAQLDSDHSIQPKLPKMWRARHTILPRHFKHSWKSSAPCTEPLPLSTLSIYSKKSDALRRRTI